MKLKNANVSALCVLGLTAALAMTSAAWADDAASSAESAVESVQESVAEEAAAESAGESAAESTEAEAAESGASSEATQSDASAEAEEEAVVERPEYNGLDYVTLGDYIGLTLEVEPIEVTEEEIDARIESNLYSSEDAKDVVEEGTVEEGDTANIDYEGKKDGVAFDGGTSEGYDLEIGSGTFIPGFEEGLVGVAIGDTVDLNLTFPEEYGNEELAGQDVVFTVTVNYVTRYKELDDELASTLSEGKASTVEEYRDIVKADLEKEAQEQRDQSAKEQLLAAACEGASVSEYPQDLVDYYIGDITNYYQTYASMYGVDFNTFLSVMVGTTEEDFPDYAKQIADQSIQVEFVVDAIAEAESLLPEGEALASAYDEIAEEFGFESGEALVEEYGEYAVNYRLMYDAVMDFLFDNAKITEKEPEAEAVESEAADAEPAAEEADAAQSETAESEAAESEAVESEAAASEAAQSEAAE